MQLENERGRMIIANDDDDALSRSLFSLYIHIYVMFDYSKIIIKKLYVNNTQYLCTLVLSSIHTL
jgi:hypothetical protein